MKSTVLDRIDKSTIFRSLNFDKFPTQTRVNPIENCHKKFHASQNPKNKYQITSSNSPHNKHCQSVDLLSGITSLIGLPTRQNTTRCRQKKNSRKKSENQISKR